MFPQEVRAKCEKKTPELACFGSQRCFFIYICLTRSHCYTYRKSRRSKGSCDDPHCPFYATLRRLKGDGTIRNAHDGENRYGAQEGREDEGRQGRKGGQSGKDQRCQKGWGNWFPPMGFIMEQIMDNAFGDCFHCFRTPPCGDGIAAGFTRRNM